MKGNGGKPPRFQYEESEVCGSHWGFDLQTDSRYRMKTNNLVYVYKVRESSLRECLSTSKPFTTILWKIVILLFLGVC